MEMAQVRSLTPRQFRTVVAILSRTSCLNDVGPQKSNATAEQHITRIALRNFIYIHQVLIANSATIAVAILEDPQKSIDTLCFRIDLRLAGSLDGNPACCFQVVNAQLQPRSALANGEAQSIASERSFEREASRLRTVGDGTTAAIRLVVRVDNHIIWSCLPVKRVADGARRGLQHRNTIMSWYEVLELVTSFGHVIYETVREDGHVHHKYGVMKLVNGKWRREEMSQNELMFFGYGRE